MGFAQYVGRVGALAVVMGVGGAVGSPSAPAWADTDGTQSSQDGGATSAADPAQGAAVPAAGVSGSAQATADTAEAVSSATDTAEAVPVSPAPGAIVDTSPLATTTTNDYVVSVNGSPAVTISAPADGTGSGRDPDPREPSDGDIDVANVSGAVEEAHDASAVTGSTGDGYVSTWQAGVHRPNAASATSREPASPGASTEQYTAATDLSVSAPASPADVIADRMLTSASASLANAQSAAQPPGPSVDVEISRPDSGPLSPVFAPIRAVVLGVLGVFGFNPDPTAPSSNPVLEAVWGLYRRIESVFANEAPEAGPSTMNFRVDETGQPVIDGQLTFTDPDFDSLSYSVTEGSATIDQNGKFTVVVADPSKPVTFTVAVSDGTSSLLGAASVTTAKFSIVLANSSDTTPVPLPDGYTPAGILGFDPRSGAGYQVIAGPDGPKITVIRADGTAITSDALPGELVGSAVVDPRTGTAVVTTTSADLSWVTVIRPDGTGLVTNAVQGTAVGSAVIDSTTGVAYQTTLASAVDPATGITTISTWVHAVVLRGIVANSVQLRGQAAEPAVVDETLRTAYQSTSGTSVDPVTGATIVTTWLSVVKPVGPAVTSTALLGDTAGSAVVDPRTGLAYQMTLQTSTDPMTGMQSATTRVYAVDIDGNLIVQESLAGFPAGPAVLDAGTAVAYVTTFDGTLDPVTGSATGTTSVTVLGADGRVAGVEALSGQPLGSVLIDPLTGVAYQGTYVSTADPGTDSLTGTTWITSITSGGAASTTATVTGVPTGPLVLNDVTGSAYLTTVNVTVDAAGTISASSQVTIIGSDGSAVSTPQLAGLPTGSTTESADQGVVVDSVAGLAYLTTINTDGTTSVYVIRTDGTVIADHHLAGGPVGNVVVDPRTHLAYQTTSRQGGILVSVIRQDGFVVTTTNPLPGSATSGVVVNPVTGDAYQTTSSGSWTIEVRPPTM